MSDSVVSSIVPLKPKPALLTSTSMRPKRSSVAWTRRSMSSARATSVGTTSASPPRRRDLVGELVEAVLAPGGEDDAGAVARELERGLAADAGAGAGDDDDGVLRVHEPQITQMTQKGGRNHRFHRWRRLGGVVAARGGAVSAAAYPAPPLSQERRADAGGTPPGAPRQRALRSLHSRSKSGGPGSFAMRRQRAT